MTGASSATTCQSWRGFVLRVGPHEDLVPVTDEVVRDLSARHIARERLMNASYGSVRDDEHGVSAHNDLVNIRGALLTRVLMLNDG